MNDNRNEGAMTLLSILTAISTAGIFILTFQLWRIHQRTVWLTGAMETHSDLMLRLQAKQQGIEMIWWDPTVEIFPFKGEHGKSVELNRILVGVTLKHRRNQPSAFRRW